MWRMRNGSSINQGLRKDKNTSRIVRFGRPSGVCHLFWLVLSIRISMLTHNRTPVGRAGIDSAVHEGDRNHSCWT